MKENVKKRLDLLYNDIGQPYALSSPRKLYEEARKEGIAASDVLNYINSQDSYTLHKPTRLRFPRNKIVIGSPRKTIVSDLADLSKLAHYNDGVKYLMLNMDGFSRLLKVYPLKNKKGKTTAETLQRSLNDVDFNGATHILTDRGSEYTSKHAKNVYKQMNITQYSTHNTVFKTSLVERLIRTLKEKIFRYLTHTNSKRYIDVLPKLVDSYNKSRHRSLNASPFDVHFNYDRTAIRALFQHIYRSDKNTASTKKSIIPLGSLVRITTDRREFVFRKSYEEVNSREKFIVDRIDLSQQYPIYYLKDLHGVEICGIFYREELIRVN